MKALRLPALRFVLILLLPIFLLATCKEDDTERITYHIRVPVYLSMAKVRAQVIAVQAAQKLAAPGKIYIYGNYLFISEVSKGIHVVDNSNPAAPRFINFINIPGNADMAVNSNILYADNYVDLIAFDITNPRHIKPLKRVEDVFDNLYVNQNKGLVTGFKDTVITEVVKRNRAVVYDSYYSVGLAANSAAQSYGTGGSTARFALMNSYLYTVGSYRLKLFNVSRADEPKFLNSITIGANIETIFPYSNKLFIGSTTGMYIYDAINPSAPVKLSRYQHVTSCDPVVVQGKYAYVTLRSGASCQQGVNVLDVLDIEDAANPVRIASYPMLNPHGLAVKGKDLFICEGQYGLKAFDNTDVFKIWQKQLSFISTINAIDVIAGPKSLIVTGSQGIYQYNYADPAALKELSHLTLDNNRL